MTTCDVAIIGGGIMGLWVARKAIEAGLDVVLVDKDTCGSGGSGGVLGALLPHLPNSMSEKNRFQFEALVELSDEIRCLEAETGVNTGYDRCGRLMPIRREGFLKTAKLCKSKSQENWVFADKRFCFEVVDVSSFDGWLNTDQAPLGLAWDSLAAKIHPQSYIAALKNFVSNSGTVMEGFEVVQIEPGSVTARDGEKLIAADIVLAAGHHSYDLLQQMTGLSFGAGVKGQAALFELDLNEQKPVLYDDGMYVVHHAPGQIAVGSTTEPVWEEEHKPEPEKATKFLKKAYALCPVLNQARLAGYWAGVRPKSLAKDPMVGRLHPESKIIMATGGFKISFGIAHRLAEVIATQLVNGSQKISLPISYQIEHHVRSGIEMGRFSNEQWEKVIW